MFVVDDDVAEEVEELKKLGIYNDYGNANEYKQRDDKEDEKVTNIRTYICNNNFIPCFNKNGLPSNWTVDPPINGLFNLVELHQGDDEHDSILNDFTAAGIAVKRVERLENRHVSDKFKTEMDHMLKDRSADFQLKECYLYHGTSVDKETLCEEGLDQRLSSMGFFGKGIYFSDNPAKCANYTQDISSKTSESYILKCRVLLGESKVYQKGKFDRELKREPKKERPSDRWKYYDSVIGCPKDYNEYVVYDNRRAMIEYVVTVEPGVKVKNRIGSAKNWKIQVKEESSPIFEEKLVQFKTPEQLSNSDDPIDEESDGFEEFYKEDKTYMRSQESATIREAELNDEEYQDRLQDVREAVRKKRNTDFGSHYAPPSKTQRENDKEVFSKLHSIHSGVKVQSEEDSSNDDFAVSEFHFDIATEPKPKEEMNDTVGQALDVCIIDFLNVTDTEDVKLARDYIIKANMDVNLAISLYYEDIIEES